MALAGLSQVVTPSAAEALRHLQAGDYAAAERLLTGLVAQLPDPQLFYLLGVARLSLSRFAEAAEAFTEARAGAPNQARPAFGHGEALARLGRDAEAAQAYRDAIRLDAAFVEARYELANALRRLGQFDAAEEALRELLSRAPAHAPARLALGGVLIEARRPGEAETVLREGLGMVAPIGLRAAFHTNLGLALRRQRKDREALEQYDQALALDAGQPGLAIHRAEALQNLQRHDEALAVYQAALATEPGEAELHRRLNDLLYRLQRGEEYLKSYDRAPQSRDLRLAKASTLLHEQRGEEALDIYQALLARDAADQTAILGAANALGQLKRHREALARLEPLLAAQDNAVLLARAADMALQSRDPQKAEHLAGRALALAPHDQLSLAYLGLAWRMMGDARDEALNDYDRDVRVFDLKPPAGFASMADFNAELCAWLDRLHPRTREFIDQSLRGGTQTPDHLFGAGHDLVDRLERRIEEAVTDYIAGMRGPENHPLVSRRAREFDYAGSWSSRLTRCGFHVNHVHPAGWISSCYYAGVPATARDAEQKQGWIKFGEPAADLGLSLRRAVQPVPGRLVLFPSYMWHGTIPFQDDAVRTTIAFDVIPQAR